MRIATGAEEQRMRSCVGLKDGRCYLMLNGETFIDFRFGLWVLQDEATPFGEDSSISPNAGVAYADQMRLVTWTEVTVVPDGWPSSPDGTRFLVSRSGTAIFIYITRLEVWNAIRVLNGIRKRDADTDAGILQLWDSVEFRLTRF